MEHSNAYKLGWNANNQGDNFLSNPFSLFAFDGFLYYEWERGFNENANAWDSDLRTPQPFSAVPSVDEIVKNQSEALTIE